MNLNDVDPTTILVDQEVVESEDVVVDTTDTVVQPGYEDDLDEAEEQVGRCEKDLYTEADMSQQIHESPKSPKSPGEAGSPKN